MNGKLAMKVAGYGLSGALHLGASFYMSAAAAAMKADSENDKFTTDERISKLCLSMLFVGTSWALASRGRAHLSHSKQWRVTRFATFTAQVLVSAGLPIYRSLLTLEPVVSGSRDERLSALKEFTGYDLFLKVIKGKASIKGVAYEALYFFDKPMPVPAPETLLQFKRVSNQGPYKLAVREHQISDSYVRFYINVLSRLETKGGEQPFASLYSSRNSTSEYDTWVYLSSLLRLKGMLPQPEDISMDYSSDDEDENLGVKTLSNVIKMIPDEPIDGPCLDPWKCSIFDGQGKPTLIATDETRQTFLSCFDFLSHALNLLGSDTQNLAYSLRCFNSGSFSSNVEDVMRHLPVAVATLRLNLKDSSYQDRLVKALFEEWTASFPNSVHEMLDWKGSSSPELLFKDSPAKKLFLNSLRSAVEKHPTAVRGVEYTSSSPLLFLYDIETFLNSNEQPVGIRQLTRMSLPLVQELLISECERIKQASTTNDHEDFTKGGIPLTGHEEYIADLELLIKQIPQAPEGFKDPWSTPLLEQDEAGKVSFVNDPAIDDLLDRIQFFRVSFARKDSLYDENSIHKKDYVAKLDSLLYPYRNRDTSTPIPEDVKTEAVALLPSALALLQREASLETKGHQLFYHQVTALVDSMPDTIKEKIGSEEVQEAIDEALDNTDEASTVSSGSDSFSEY
jgi:hypothetical protein